MAEIPQERDFLLAVYLQNFVEKVKQFSKINYLINWLGLQIIWHFMTLSYLFVSKNCLVLSRNFNLIAFTLRGGCLH